MRFAIFGSGGVGGYFGGRLAQAGNDVTFIARGEHLHALRTKGLTIESLNGDFVVSSVKATDDPAQLNNIDVVIVGVKAWQVTEAARAMKPMIAPNTCVLPLQNGVEASEQLSAVLERNRCLVVCAELSATESHQDTSVMPVSSRQSHSESWTIE